MANTFIKPIYRNVYGEAFDYGNFGKRMKMQKCVYLLEQLGLNIGDYDFSWYKHGPYSQQLQNDMYEENSKEESILYYSELAQNILKQMQKMVKIAGRDGFGYTEEQWMECLASVHYLNRLFQGNHKRALDELFSRKPHLNNFDLNEEAYELVASIK